MNRERACSIVIVAAIALLASGSSVRAGDEKAVIGSYRLAKRVMLDGKEVAPPDVIGFMTFAHGYRTVIMKWAVPGAEPGSIAEITSYSLDGGRFCEKEEYGVNANIGGAGVIYDKPAADPSCSVAVSDASGLAFDIPGEKLRLRVVRDGILATATKWTDHWERVK